MRNRGGRRRLHGPGQFRQCAAIAARTCPGCASSPSHRQRCQHRLGRSRCLKESLRAAFTTYQRAIAFGEGGGRQHQLGLRRCPVFHVVEHHDVLARQEGVHRIPPAARRYRSFSSTISGLCPRHPWPHRAAGASISARPRLLHSGTASASAAPGSAHATLAAAWITASLPHPVRRRSADAARLQRPRNLRRHLGSLSILIFSAPSASPHLRVEYRAGPNPGSLFSAVSGHSASPRRVPHCPEPPGSLPAHPAPAPPQNPTAPVVRRAAKRPRRHIVQPRAAGSGNEQRASLVLRRFTHSVVLPQRNLQLRPRSPSTAAGPPAEGSAPSSAPHWSRLRPEPKPRRHASTS